MDSSLPDEAQEMSGLTAAEKKKKSEHSKAAVENMKRKPQKWDHIKSRVAEEQAIDVMGYFDRKPKKKTKKKTSQDEHFKELRKGWN